MQVEISHTIPFFSSAAVFSSRRTLKTRRKIVLLRFSRYLLRAHNPSSTVNHFMLVGNRFPRFCRHSFERSGGKQSAAIGCCTEPFCSKDFSPLLSSQGWRIRRLDPQLHIVLTQATASVSDRGDPRRRDIQQIVYRVVGVPRPIMSVRDPTPLPKLPTCSCCHVQKQLKSTEEQNLQEKKKRLS